MEGEDRIDPFKELQEFFKNSEVTEECIPPTESFLVRIDGQAFGTLLKSKKLNIKKPHDIRFSNAMVFMAGCLLYKFKASVAYVCSDEVSLLFPRICSSDKYAEDSSLHHNYSGRTGKICSLIASTAAAVFNAVFNAVFKDAMALNSSVGDTIQGGMPFYTDCDDLYPAFDARIIRIPEGGEEKIMDYMELRQYICHRNAVEQYAHRAFGVKEIFKVDTETRIKQMGAIWEEVPSFIKYGVYVKKGSVSLKKKKINCAVGNVFLVTGKLVCDIPHHWSFGPASRSKIDTRLLLELFLSPKKWPRDLANIVNFEIYPG